MTPYTYAYDMKMHRGKNSFGVHTYVLNQKHKNIPAKNKRFEEKEKKHVRHTPPARDVAHKGIKFIKISHSQKTNIYSPNLEWFLIFPTQRSCFGSTNCCDPLRQHRGLCLKSSNFHTKIFFLHAPRLITTTCDTHMVFSSHTCLHSLTHSLTFFFLSFFLLLLGNLQSH